MVNVLTRWVLDVKPFSWRVPASTHDPEGGHPYMFPSFPQFLEAYYRGEKNSKLGHMSSNILSYLVLITQPMSSKPLMKADI
jgi:hypothetical protein